MRQHYKPAPEHRASAALQFVGVLVAVALFFGPFFFYFWGMTP